MVQICCVRWTSEGQNAVSSPDPLTRVSAPRPRWELRPQTPVIGSRSALAMWPPKLKFWIRQWLRSPQLLREMH